MAKLTYFTLSNGDIYACGSNNLGQLALGDYTERLTPTKITISNVRDVKSNAMSNNTVFLMNDGTVYGCGFSTFSALGAGGTPVKMSLSNVKDIVCGGTTVVALLEDGTVWGCGDNSCGQLGFGDTNNRISFTKLNMTDIKFIVCSGNDTIFVSNTGETYGCGLNAYNHGQLGLNDNDNRLVPTKLNVSNVKAICAAPLYNIFSLNDGSVYGCGDNSQGALGLGNITNVLVPTLIIEKPYDILTSSAIVAGLFSFHTH